MKSSSLSDECSRNSKKMYGLFEDLAGEQVLFESQVVKTSKGLVSSSRLE